MLVSILISLAVTLLSAALAPKPKITNAKAKDIEIPTPASGDDLPVYFGEVWEKNPKIAFYGNKDKDKIRDKIKTGLFSSKKVTVGFYYYLDIHFILSNGPIESVTEIRTGDRRTFSGNLTSSTTFLIDKPSLFGGEDSEGGVFGIVDYMDGSSDQVLNPGLVSSILSATGSNEVPGFRGLTSFVFRGVRGSGYSGTPWQSGSSFLGSASRTAQKRMKASFCWSANNSYFKATWFKVRNRTIADWYPAKAAIGNQMNPAHIIYAVINGNVWVGGIGGATINETSFIAAADTLYDEGLGLGFKWSSSISRKDFLADVCSHIQGNISTNPKTGEWEITLVRDDLVVEDLVELNEFNCKVIEWSTRGLADTVNEVIVTYTRPDNGKPDTISVSDTSNVIQQGRTVTQEIEYLGCHDPDLAAKLGYRDLALLSQPLDKVSIEANRVASSLTPGKAFVLNFPTIGFENKVFRVVQRSEGSIISGGIALDCIEDVFTAADASIVSAQPDLWVDPSQEAEDIENVYITEMPYYELFSTTLQSDRDEWEPETGFVQTFALAPNQDSFEYLVLDTSADEFRDNGEFVNGGVLTQEVPASVSSTVLTLDSLGSLVTFSDNVLGYLGQELVEITAVDFDNLQVTVNRGLFDTVPKPHVIDTPLYMFDDTIGGNVDGTPRVSGEGVVFKLLTQTSYDLLDEVDATAHGIIMANRYERPYPPANLKINTVNYPSYITGAISVSWVERNRITQDTAVTLQTDATVTPEAGTTYTVKFYSRTGSLLHTASGLTGTSYSWSTESADSGGALNGRVRVEVTSNRDGLESWQPNEHTFDRAGYGLNYGLYYGDGI